MINLNDWPHRWYGRWKEEANDTAVEHFPSIIDVSGAEWDDDEIQKVVSYLRSGTVAIASPGIARNVVDGTQLSATTSWKSDGVWLWPDTLAHYLQRYRIQLPGKLVDHIRANGYVVPSVPEHALRNLDLPTF